MSYRLLDKFRSIFSGVRYLHRSSLLGDSVAMELYEDLQVLRRSHLLCGRIERRERVLNVQNRVRGIRARRGDGTFGELVPGVEAIQDPGFLVARGPIATVEIGTEVKILSKAMLKQIDRVIGDLVKQAAQFRQRGATPICVGIVGVNYAAVTTSYERDRVWITDGKGYKHPLQEAASAFGRGEIQLR